MKDYVKNIPAHTLDSIERYVEFGHPTGGFLHAVLTNNLFGAAGQGDEANLRALPEICMYIYNRIPDAAWGTEKKVKAWYEARRAEGPFPKEKRGLSLIP